MTRGLHTEAYKDWRDEATEEYIQAQRRAFLDGFEAAAQEAEQFGLLREWLEEERDAAKDRYAETEDDFWHVRYLAFVDVLVKLSEMGCRPGDENGA